MSGVWVSVSSFDPSILPSWEVFLVPALDGTAAHMALSAKAVMGFEVRKSHLDLLGLVARLFELRHTHEAAGMIAGILVGLRVILREGCSDCIAA